MDRYATYDSWQQHCMVWCRKEGTKWSSYSSPIHITRSFSTACALVRVRARASGRACIGEGWDLFCSQFTIDSMPHKLKHILHADILTYFLSLSQCVCACACVRACVFVCVCWGDVWWYLSGEVATSCSLPPESRHIFEHIWMQTRLCARVCVCVCGGGGGGGNDTVSPSCIPDLNSLRNATCQISQEEVKRLKQ